jgi:hypothetical protein
MKNINEQLNIKYNKFVQLYVSYNMPRWERVLENGLWRSISLQIRGELWGQLNNTI